ncbi:MAG: hypothetical protein JXB35_07930, partial [Anaerolineae bacterium]|nr:hypothetical protein [Anaerolineae bacterium]
MPPLKIAVSPQPSDRLTAMLLSGTQSFCDCAARCDRLTVLCPTDLQVIIHKVAQLTTSQNVAPLRG